MLFILAQTSAYRLGSKIPVVTLGNVLPRVFVVAIPSGFRTSKRACEAVASGLEIKDGVSTTDLDHDRILVRTHNVCDVVEHRFL